MHSACKWLAAISISTTALLGPALAQDVPDWVATHNFTAPDGAAPGQPMAMVLQFETTEMAVQTSPEDQFIRNPWAWWGIFDPIAATDPDGAVPLLDLDAQLFPGLSLELAVLADGTVLPLDRGLIRNPVATRTASFWELIAGPGAAWMVESGDMAGWSQAAFPVSLVQSQEGEAWVGLASFYYRDGETTDMRVQFSSVAAGGFIFWDADFDAAAWAEVPVAASASDADLAALMASHQAETAARPAMQPIAALGDGIAAVVAAADPAATLAIAVLKDGVLYSTDVETPFGPHPYPGDMRIGVWSASKSMVAGMAALRLAEKYGTDFLDVPIVSLFEEGREFAFADADSAARWGQVTIRDALLLETGMGPTGYDSNWAMESINTYQWSYSYDLADQIRFYFAQTPNPDVAGAGEAHAYIDQDMWMAALAMERYLQSREGPDASLLEMLVNEVYTPIGAAHFVSGTSYTPDGSPGFPYAAWGVLPTLDHMALAGQLVANGGRSADGTQILNAEAVASLFASEDYAYAFWKAALGDGQFAAQASGAGGNYILALPNGVVGVVSSRDNYNHGWDDAAIAAFVQALAAL